MKSILSRGVSLFKVSIISRHIFSQFFGPYIVAGLFFTFIIMVFYLKEVIRIAIEKNLSFFLVGELMFYSLGWTLSMTLPMAALMAVIMAVGRLNGDSELVAMRAGGITYPRIFRPFLIFGIVMTLFSFWYSHVVIPFCYNQIATISRTINRADPAAILTPGQFVSLGKTDTTRQVIYIGEKKKDKKNEVFRNIQIRKTVNANGHFRLSELIIAQEAQQIEKTTADKKKYKALRLFQGFVFSSNDNNTIFQRIDFSKGSLDINLNFQNKIDVSLNENDFSAFDSDALDAAIKKYVKATDEKHQRYYLQAKTEYHKRNALPFATIFFLFLGFPLGISNRRSGKGSGLGISIIFIFAYFALFLMADSLAASAKVASPIVAAWLANIAVVLTGTWFFYKRTMRY